jgi:hypothetical protein
LGEISPARRAVRLAVSLCVILVILDVYPLRRLAPAAGGWLGPAQGAVWAEKVPFPLVSLAGSRRLELQAASQRQDDGEGAAVRTPC